jgi:hypothetical protein
LWCTGIYAQPRLNPSLSLLILWWKRSCDRQSAHVFPCTGYWYDVEAPLLSGSSNQPQFLVVSAFVTFTPRIAPGTVEYITNLDLGFTLSIPSNLSVVPSTTGGTLTSGNKYWVVTAVDANGETTRSSEVTSVLTGSTSSAVLSWTGSPGAVSYNVYRGTTAGGETTLVANTPNTTYTDTGAAGTSVTPPSTNTAEVSANTALAIAPIQARILSGQLQTIDQADTPNIQLLANTPVLGLSKPLIYDVAFTNVVYASSAQVLNNFAFTAPTSSTTVNLTDPTLTRLPYNPTAY